MSEDVEPGQESEAQLGESRVEHELPKCYPHCRGKPWYGGNKEALAWVLDAAGRSINYIAAGAFLATALLRLAKEAAGCETDPPEGETQVPECDGRVHGIRPSSLLTTYTIVIGIASATLLPLMGSMVDYTPHRRLLGQICAALFCIFMFPQIFIGENTWFMVAILQIVVGFIGWGHTLLAYAYLPELTSDDKLLNKYTSNFTVVQFGSMVVFLIVIVGISFATGMSDDEVAVARLGMAIAFVLTSSCFVYAWKLFDKRPATQQLPEGASIWTEGFKHIGRTSKLIYREFRSLGWFYVAVATGDAAIQSLTTVLVTYFTDVMAFSSFENGIVILILLLASVPGAFLSGWFINRYENAIWSSLISSCILVINTFLASAILTGPGQQIRAYAVSALYGVGTGWKWSSDKLMSATLIPGRHAAEMMGLYLFAGQCLTWLPPLIFTGLNEAGLSQRVNIAILNVYIFLSIIAYLRMGKYQDALELAKSSKVEVRSETDPDEQQYKTETFELANAFSSNDAEDSAPPSPL